MSEVRCPPSTLNADLDELAALLARATDGPWESGRIYGSDDESWLWEGTHHHSGDPDAPDTRFGQVSTANAEAIVAMRNALPGLIDELRTLRAREPMGQAKDLEEEGNAGYSEGWNGARNAAVEACRKRHTELKEADNYYGAVAAFQCAEAVLAIGECTLAEPTGGAKNTSGSEGDDKSSGSTETAIDGRAVRRDGRVADEASPSVLRSLADRTPEKSAPFGGSGMPNRWACAHQPTCTTEVEHGARSFDEARKQPTANPLNDLPAHRHGTLPNGWPQPTFLNVGDDGGLCIEWMSGPSNAERRVTFFYEDGGAQAIRSRPERAQEYDEDSTTATLTLKSWLDEQRSEPQPRMADALDQPAATVTCLWCGDDEAHTTHEALCAGCSHVLAASAGPVDLAGRSRLVGNPGAKTIPGMLSEDYVNGFNQAIKGITEELERRGYPNMPAWFEAAGVKLTPHATVTKEK